ncbi:alpha/beta hydrolase [Meiothermus sp. QL-1]|uniref:alpha/beta hydrolase n=1 Tax=Meiothermus sp. QL-1 TaxID=2058095 RepID=UPI000E0AA21E|nr:alpha/beta hydrolase [Meiothermus sp. QL-1]RDI94907.1 alpha/beta hydrolase [Meiothermus sp. QL-1]
MENPSWLELQYSPRLTVPDAAGYFRRWAEEAKAARAALPHHPSLAYGPGPKETLDLFPAPQSRYLLVFIHGGYWRAFDKDDFSWLAPPLVEAGVSLAVLNYDLCPAVSIGQIVEECRRAVAWLYRAAPRYGLSGLPILLSGHSAGGHLTAELFATPWAEYGVPEAAFAGGIAISGLFDLEPLLQVSFNTDLRLTRESARALSPIHKRPTLRVPLVLGVGELESSEFQRQSRLLQQAWPEVCPGVWRVPNAHHFNVLEALADPRSELWRPF